MANIFSGKKTAGKTVEEDFIAQGGAVLFDTNIYPATIKAAYLQKAQRTDAQSLNIIFTVKGKEMPIQIWMTTRDGSVTYKDKKTGEERNLPGYSQVNAICMLIAGKDVGDMEVEEQTLKLFDYDAKKDLPKAVDCFTELHGMAIQIAIQRQIVDKNERNSDGKYVPMGKTKEIMDLVKVFPEDKRVTLSEVVQHIESLGGNLDDVLDGGEMNKAVGSMSNNAGKYAVTWLEKNADKTYDKSTKTAGSGSEGKSFGSGKAKSKEATAGGTSLFD